ncbi:hypothetical protein D9615_007974 [Tricholomella constricta]|uniref:F-box domain-containing protein n=1 Tax=Tricholomella constricta TaxID=117010 RepID=A0A8H5H2K7_9AGAR|nr:hypothetical protein D9615_007974 [Tricholomella constricta]
MASYLSYDILVQVLELLTDDLPSLYHSSLVNWDFNHAASRILYARIQYSPLHRHVLDLKDRGTDFGTSMIASACTAQNAQLVVELEINGFISTRSSPLFILCDTIAHAIEKFINLSKLTLCPITYHQSLFTKTLELLPALTHLRELTVNSSCMGSETAPLLTRIEGLRKLTLRSPGRLILDSLPGWLERLSPTLVGLHLKDNCGSITPGVLKSLVPHVCERLRDLTLGLSYSLTDDDVFSFMAQLPHLERLQLHYPDSMNEQQLKPPKFLPNLTRLKYFAVNYIPTHTRHDVLALCRWVKRIISFSPLEHIRLMCVEPPVSIPFDSLVDHLVKKHHKTLRVLDFGYAYAGVDAAKAVFTSCLQLEEFRISARRGVLDTFQELSPRLARLHTAAFRIRNAKMKKALVDDDLATEIITHGPPSLRRLLVNGAMWEGSWVSGNDADVRFVVRRVRGLGGNTVT